jgi:hypothetical protein
LSPSNKSKRNNFLADLMAILFPFLIDRALRRAC